MNVLILFSFLTIIDHHMKPTPFILRSDLMENVSEKRTNDPDGFIQEPFQTH